MKIIILSIMVVAIAGITMSTIMASAQDYNIPDWIKNNAAWWADGQIPDSAFVNGIKFLIENGIMEIESSQSSSQTSEVSNFQDNGDFYLVYDNVSSEWQAYEEFIMSENYFEDQVLFLNGLLKLPYDVEILITTCGQANAFYSPSEKKIEICYEYVAEKDDRFSQIYEMGTIELDTAVIDVVDSTFYHELGHAIIDIYQLPYTGLNEDAADQFSNYIMTEHTEAGIGQRVLENTALGFYLLHEESGMESALYADTHSLNIQRFQNTVCFAYGSDPTGNADEWLPQDRIYWCVEEYEHGVRAWNFLLEPYFK